MSNDLPAIAKPKVAVIGTGGTISSLAIHTLDTIDYPDSGLKLSIHEVIAAVPEAGAVANVFAVPFRSVSSTALTPSDWLVLRETVVELLESDPSLSGIVILHGTGSLEETAFFLYLTLSTNRPVVLVGAQRPLNAVGSDAPMNLIAALRTAGDPSSAGRGVLVVMNDEIHSARDVVKTSNYRVQTFRSPDFGMIGQVDADSVIYRRHPEARDKALLTFMDLPKNVRWPRVDIIYSHLGADAVLIDAAVSAGAAGLISAGFPPGLLTPAVQEALARLVSRGFPVVLSSRAHAGRVGKRSKPDGMGFIAGSDLSPQKARILLMLSIVKACDLDAMRLAFERV